MIIVYKMNDTKQLKSITLYKPNALFWKAFEWNTPPNKMKVRMTRKHNNHTPQTNPRYLEEVPQNIYSNKNIRKTIKAKQPALSLFLFKMSAKLKGHKVMQNKSKT